MHGHVHNDAYFIITEHFVFVSVFVLRDVCSFFVLSIEVNGTGTPKAIFTPDQCILNGDLIRVNATTSIRVAHHPNIYVRTC